jgi:hypothetical protein
MSLESEELQQPAAKAVGEKNYGRSKKTNRWYNLSAYFLVPIIISQGRTYGGFVNSYLYCVNDKCAEAGDMNHTTDVDYIYIELSRISFDLSTHKRYKYDFKTKEDTFIYVFDITDFKDDIELFIQGKYSKLSQKLKNILCKSESPSTGEMYSNIYKILYRTQDKREKLEKLIGEKLSDDAELCSSPDIEEEIRYE